MDNDLRASLVAAGAAFLLSALAGALSRVAVLPLLGRAAAGAAIFGGLAFGALRLLRSARLLEGAAEDRQDARSDEGLGRSVDIVLQDEASGPVEPFDRPAEEAESLGDLGEPEPGAFPDAAKAAPPGAEAGEPTPARRPEARARGPAAPAERDEPALEPEEVGSLLGDEGSEEEAAVPPPSFAPAGQAAESFDDLDVLPDLEGFSDSFAAPEYRDSGTGRGEGQRAGGGAASARVTAAAAQLGGREGLDPASLAKAVSTMLKRDQKG